MILTKCLTCTTCPICEIGRSRLIGRQSSRIRPYPTLPYPTFLLNNTQDADEVSSLHDLTHRQTRLDTLDSMDGSGTHYRKRSGLKTYEQLRSLHPERGHHAEEEYEYSLERWVGWTRSPSSWQFPVFSFAFYGHVLCSVNSFQRETIMQKKTSINSTALKGECGDFLGT